MEQLQAFGAGIAWQSAMPVAAGLVVTFAVLSILMMRRRVLRLERRVQAAESQALKLAAEADRQRQARRKLDESLRYCDERIGQLELRAASRPYEQAIRMAAQGGTEDRLMRYFGLTDGEAALVSLLHGDVQHDPSSESTRNSSWAESSVSRG